MEYYLEGYGVLNGVTIAEKYNTGEVESFQVEDFNTITINDVDYVPSYTLENTRKKEYPSIKLYKSGKIKSLNLEETTQISIPSGIFNVEKVVFYESGELKRLFHLNGKISGYWSEEDEYNLAEEYDFDFKFAKFKAKIISIQLFKNGNIKSITLWPKERIKIMHNDNLINIHTGFSMYESGELETCEPLYPVNVSTPIGNIEAYDKNSVGIHGENNSLKFNKDGTIKALTTSTNVIKIINNNGEEIIYSPEEVLLYVNSEIKDLITVKLEFVEDKIIINGQDEYNIHDNRFVIERFGEKKLTLIGNM